MRALVALLVAGCARPGPPRDVAVQLLVDPACSSPAISCAGEVAIHLVDADTDAPIESRCLPLDEATGRTLDNVPALLEAAQVDLGTLPQGRPFVIELAVWSPASNCPRARPEQAPVGLTHFGRTAVTRLEGEPAPIPLTISCVQAQACGGPPPPPPPSCLRYASTTGSDSTGTGEKAQPFRSAQKLLDSLNPGQTGCLEAGTYAGNVTVTKGGQAGEPITLASVAGVRATLQGRLIINAAADYLVVEGLLLNGKNPGNGVSPHLFADHVVLRNNHITTEGASSCLYVGDGATGATVTGIVLEKNRFFDCGGHGLSISGGKGTVFRDNYVYGNDEFAMQIYPDADDSIIEYNVFDGNNWGVHFGGSTSLRSERNVVRHNIISNTQNRHNVDSNWDGAVGTGNVVEENCLWNGNPGNLGGSGGYTATNNTVADPQFVDRLNGDFRMNAGSPCAQKGPRSP